MLMKIIFTKKARKQLTSVESGAAKRIRQKIGQYAANPESLVNHVKHLKGSEYFRLRVGDYRVIFTEAGMVLLIIEVGHRREVYR